MEWRLEGRMQGRKKGRKEVVEGRIKGGQEEKANEGGRSEEGGAG